MIEAARSAGLTVREIPLTRHDVYVADEVFLTGTAAEVIPVVKIDNRTIGTGAPGPITKTLQTAYLDTVQGRRPCPEGWLTLVR